MNKLNSFLHQLIMLSPLILLMGIIIGKVYTYGIKQEKPIITIVDTSRFRADTVKLIQLKHLTSSNLYGLHCKMCHGVYGKGDGVKARHDITICPYDLTKITKPDKEIYYIVLNGQDKMPNQYELDNSDVWVIVIYIKKFRK